MRVAVVDDREDSLLGRVLWLQEAGHVPVGYSFDAALAETAWSTFDAVVLDGRDDRETPLRLGEGDLPDRYLGPRVAGHIRSLCGEDQPKIILVSAYARTHPELSLRCQEAGVDYAFDYLDVSTSSLFVRAVESPRDAGTRSPTDWRSAGFKSPPRIAEALAEAEASRAAIPLLTGGAVPGDVTPYDRRRLRERLGRLLPLAVYSSGGVRKRLLRNNELRPVLRRLLGLNSSGEIEDDIRF